MPGLRPTHRLGQQQVNNLDVSAESTQCVSARSHGAHLLPSQAKQLQQFLEESHLWVLPACVATCTGMLMAQQADNSRADLTPLTWHLSSKHISTDF